MKEIIPKCRFCGSLYKVEFDKYYCTNHTCYNHYSYLNKEDIFCRNCGSLYSEIGNYYFCPNCLKLSDFKQCSNRDNTNYFGCCIGIVILLYSVDSKYTPEDNLYLSSFCNMKCYKSKLNSISKVFVDGKELSEYEAKLILIGIIRNGDIPNNIKIAIYD